MPSICALERFLKHWVMWGLRSLSVLWLLLSLSGAAAHKAVSCVYPCGLAVIKTYKRNRCFEMGEGHVLGVLDS